MSDAREFGGGRPVDLSQLSEAELNVLRLLAQGHTAKSIANALGSTPTAINERLRQARRKTGVGSSREVARLLTAHENRDKEIEAAGEIVRRFHGPQASEGYFRAHWIGTAVMILAPIAALAVATYHSAPPVVPAAPNNAAINDPMVGAIPPSSEFGIDQLYLRLRREKRDSHWSARTEQQLRGYLTSIQYVGEANNSLRVMCGTTLCEAAGVIDAPISKQDETSLKSPLNRSMHALQGKDIHDFAASMGLDILGASFQSPTKRSTPRFLIYFQRKH